MNGEIVGENIRYARKTKGYTQAELGGMVFTDGKYISRLENGKCMPSIRRLVQLSKALEVSCDYFLQGFDCSYGEEEDANVMGNC
jgi:transcriptional regulator with XRE-family HTH domain